jgi:aryl-alcohol dehydrogenase-like predicted oxidoreductase
MKYRYLGSSGLLVSRITLGTMTFGAGDWGCDEKTAHQIMKQYLDAGGNHLDAADVYAGGRAEEIIGTFLPQLNRDDVIIASKCYFPMGQQANQYGTSKKHLIASCEASLKRMKTDHIDLYYIHGPDPITPLEKTLRAMDDLVSQGKVRYLGCSNLFGWQIAKAAGIIASRRYEGLIVGQYLYNLINREAEREIIPSAVDNGLGLVCYSPLGGGLLTGKYKGMNEPAEGSRLAYRTAVDGPRFWHKRGFQVAEALEKVSSEAGVPMSKLAIAWPLGRKFVTSMIIGVKNTDQLKSNMEIGDWDMPDDVWKTLEEKTRPGEDYLNWFAKANFNRFFSAAEFHDETRELP